MSGNYEELKQEYVNEHGTEGWFAAFDYMRSIGAVTLPETKRDSLLGSDIHSCDVVLWSKPTGSNENCYFIMLYFPVLKSSGYTQPSAVTVASTKMKNITDRSYKAAARRVLVKCAKGNNYTAVRSREVLESMKNGDNNSLPTNT